MLPGAGLVLFLGRPLVLVVTVSFSSSSSSSPTSSTVTKFILSSEKGKIKDIFRQYPAEMFLIPQQNSHLPTQKKQMFCWETCGRSYGSQDRWHHKSCSGMAWGSWKSSRCGPVMQNSSKGPTSQPTGLTRSHGNCQTPQDTPRDPVSMPWWVRTNWIHSRASMNWTWGPTSPGWCLELMLLSLKSFCSVDGRIFIRGIRFKTPTKERTGRMLNLVYVYFGFTWKKSFALPKLIFELLWQNILCVKQYVIEWSIQEFIWHISWWTTRDSGKEPEYAS